MGISSGKYYFEVTMTSGTIAGFLGGITVTQSGNAAVASNMYGYHAGGIIFYPGGTLCGQPTLSTNDVVGFKIDLDSNTIDIYKNNSLVYAGTSIPSGTYFPVYCGTNGGSMVSSWNFGQRPFAYTAPSGFKALCTANLPAPVVTKPSTVFDVVLDTGANILTSTKALCGGNANFLWIKDRANNSTNHHLIDIVRDTALDGTPFLASNSTSDETTLGTYSAPAGNSVGWGWYAGPTTDNNNQDGSITSSVRANPSAGFSIVTYTGNGTAGASIGHGLGVSPVMIIVKNRTRSMNWWVYGSAVDSNNNYGLFFNTTDARQNLGGYGHNNTYPTSSVFYGGIGGSTTFSYSNYSGDNYVAYCFAPVAGYSSFGSYTGNGSTDGPCIYTGFRPRWIMVKRTDVANEWTILDSNRSPYNEAKLELYPSASASEGASGGPVDINSNGFKMRTTRVVWNASSGTYIYAAFAESPFQYARAR
jgi:hypothetical protein